MSYSPPCRFFELTPCRIYNARLRYLAGSHGRSTAAKQGVGTAPIESAATQAVGTAPTKSAAPAGSSSAADTDTWSPLNIGAFKG